MSHSFSRMVPAASFGLACFLSSTALAVNVIVPGTADPWLAGMPNGSTASFDPGSGEPGDVAPAESPVLVPLPVFGGEEFTWTATGRVGHPGDVTDPDGQPFLLNTSHANGAENGISDITVPIDSLIGVFLGPSQPDLTPAPAGLDFSTAAARDYLSLAPALKQTFFLGDGVGSGGAAQTLIAPAGATRLFLGTMDAFSWNNNIGNFDVKIRQQGVPDAASTLGLLGLALAGLIGFRRNR